MVDSSPSRIRAMIEDEENPSYLYGDELDLIDVSFAWSESAIDDASSDSSGMAAFKFPSLLFPTGRFRSFGENLTVLSGSSNGSEEEEEEEEKPIFHCGDPDDYSYDSSDRDKTFLSLTSLLSSKSQRAFAAKNNSKNKSQCTSADFSFAKILGACSGGMDEEGWGEEGDLSSSIRDDDDDVPNDVLSWMQDKMELVASLATGDDSMMNNPRYRKKAKQYKWGTKPTLDEMSSTSSDSTKSTKYREFLFVDNESTSWEATDNDDSLLDEYPRPGYRKTESFTSSALGASSYASSSLSLLAIGRQQNKNQSRRGHASQRFQTLPTPVSNTTAGYMRTSRNKIRNQISIVPPSPPRHDFTIVRDHRNKTEKPTKAEI